MLSWALHYWVTSTSKPQSVTVPSSPGTRHTPSSWNVTLSTLSHSHLLFFFYHPQMPFSPDFPLTGFQYVISMFKSSSPVTAFLFQPKSRRFSIECFITNTNFYGLNHNIGIFMYTCFCCLTLLIEQKLREARDSVCYSPITLGSV